MSRKLTPQSSLENLKNEAKRWLKALRANIAEARVRLARAIADPPSAPTLRDVQHALARELGFSGWAALKERLAQGTPSSPIEEFERKAANLLEAYRTGTPEAMQRHWADTWHRRSWDGMRRYVQLDLGLRAESAEGLGPESGERSIDITLDQARWLVARQVGFESWDALVKGKREGGRGSGGTPVRSAGIETVFEGHGLMTDEMLEQISHASHITTLRLGGSRFLTAAAFQYLARMTQLRELDFGGCAVTDREIAVLAELPALERVGLWGTPVSDAGVAAALGTSEHLQRVDLSGTATGDDAIAALAGKPRLSHFKSGNRVTDTGIPRLHDFPVFKTWQGGEYVQGLTSYEPEPNNLFLRGSFTDRGLASLTGLDGLFGLNVDDRHLAISAMGLEPLVSLANLGSLAFDATDEAMPFIARMPRLRFLMCQDTVAGDEGFVALGRSRSIESIWGRRCYNLRGRGFTALAGIPTLKNLSVSCKNVDDAALSVLPRFPALRELMPMDIPDEGYRHIGKCEMMESLVLMYCRETGDVATSHITGLSRLTKYFASYTRITDRTPEMLATMPALESIDLGGCPAVTNAGVAALAKAPALKTLSLSGMQNVTSESVAGFPERIRVRYSL